jgi:glucose-6-phosphate isomerase
VGHDGFRVKLDAALEELRDARIVQRIWDRDHTVWRPDPTEIANRLGWLDSFESMVGEIAAIEAFASEIRGAGVRDVVLLGMGGSSLGAEALRATLAPRASPRLQVLDSTVPAWVERVARSVDPASTLFLVASKSGTTAEVQALFDFFWQRATEAGPHPGRHFVAITDPATPLARLAEERSFRRLFVNPPDIGGRFSVLSFFGLVPAALAGIDLRRLLDSAAKARQRCGPGVPPAQNPGARLGAFLGAGARQGRDKATLLLPPPLASLGLWVEQLVAESTGKDGTGILPVTGEPWAAPEHYGDDRSFVAVEAWGDDSAGGQAERLVTAGLPVFDLPLAEPSELGGQLFVWQLATAVAGHLLGIHPFDQPDVQAAKDRTGELLARFEAEGALPDLKASENVAEEVLREPPTYVAFLAFTDSTPELEDAMGELRGVLLERHRMPTTFGYGPRYLHSTGQLHKGGPPGGLHIQLVSTRQAELPIPGRPYGFETLAAAQAAGDLLALRQSGRRALRLELDELRPDENLDRVVSLLRRG